MTLFCFGIGEKKSEDIITTLVWLMIPNLIILLQHEHGRIAGIEPASSPWQREILPFDHIRIFCVPDMHAYVHTYMIYHICVWIIFVPGYLSEDSN